MPSQPHGLPLLQHHSPPHQSFAQPVQAKLHSPKCLQATAAIYSLGAMFRVRQSSGEKLAVAVTWQTDVVYRSQAEHVSYAYCRFHVQHSKCSLSTAEVSGKRLHCAKNAAQCWSTNKAMMPSFAARHQAELAYLLGRQQSICSSILDSSGSILCSGGCSGSSPLSSSGHPLCCLRSLASQARGLASCSLALLHHTAVLLHPKLAGNCLLALLLLQVAQDMAL